MESFHPEKCCHYSGKEPGWTALIGRRFQEKGEAFVMPQGADSEPLSGFRRQTKNWSGLFYIIWVGKTPDAQTYV